MTIALAPASPFPAAYVTAECRVGREDPDWPGGCPRCRAPGYQHPILGWVDVPCACPHHAEGAQR